MENSAPKKSLGYYKIMNIACTTDIGVKISLKDVCIKLKNTEFNPDKYPACILRLYDPESFTAIIFSNGKINFTGVKSFKNMSLGAATVLKLLKHLGYKFDDPQIYLTALAAHGALKHPIMLSRLSQKKQDLQRDVENNSWDIKDKGFFEVDIIETHGAFPGLKIIFKEPSCFANLYASGKFILTGLKDYKKLPEIVEKLGSLCEGFFVQPEDDNVKEIDNFLLMQQ